MTALRRCGLVLALAVSLAGCPREPDSTRAGATGAPGDAITMTERTDPAPSALSPNVDVELWKEGVDFFADGADPDWALTMDFDGPIVFSPAEGPPRHVKATKPDRAQDADVVRYRSVTDEVELIITLEGVACDSRPWLTHRVRADLTEPGRRDYVSYEGCGRFTIDPRLNDIWALTVMSNQALDPARLPKGTPVLELHLRDRRILGHSGCSDFEGTFAIVEPGTIRFSPLVVTRVRCPEPEVEERLLALVSGRELRYSLISRGLVLEDPKGNRLEYRKVD